MFFHVFDAEPEFESIEKEFTKSKLLNLEFNHLIPFVITYVVVFVLQSPVLCTLINAQPMFALHGQIPDVKVWSW